MSDLRQRLALALDPQLRRQPGLSLLNRMVIAGIVVLVLIAILETEVTLVERLGFWFEAVKWLLFVGFVAEYLARLWVAPVNPAHGGLLRYALSPSALLDLAVLLSFVLPFLGGSTALLRGVQLLRILRLARMGRYSRAMMLLTEAVRSRSAELTLSFVMAFALMVAASTLLYLVESGVQPDHFGSIPRAMWWAVATLTTVGYGDVVPHTALGRVLASITALCGIGIIALPAGVLAGAFSEAIRLSREADARLKAQGEGADKT